MRVLVTGGAGFIGQHLVRALLARRDDVVVLDDLSTGRASQLPSEVHFVRGDVRDPELVDAALADVDLVFHLAAAVGPELVARDPAGTWARNVQGTAVVLDACAVRGLRVLVVSSSEVYGDLALDPSRGGAPLAEDEPVQIRAHGRRDVYAVSKLAAETYALALHRTHLLPVTVVRPFNVVGPGQSARYGMVLARFAEAAVSGRPLPVYGDGTQRRCFLHVDDAVALLLSLVTSARSEGLIVNLGSDEETTIRDLAERVSAMADVPLAIESIPFEQVYGEGFTDPPLRRPDLSRLESLTDVRRTRTLDDAIADAIHAARGARVS